MHVDSKEMMGGRGGSYRGYLKNLSFRVSSVYEVGPYATCPPKKAQVKPELLHRTACIQTWNYASQASEHSIKVQDAMIQKPL